MLFLSLGVDGARMPGFLSLYDIIVGYIICGLDVVDSQDSLSHGWQLIVAGSSSETVNWDINMCPVHVVWALYSIVAEFQEEFQEWEILEGGNRCCKFSSRVRLWLGHCHCILFVKLSQDQGRLKREGEWSPHVDGNQPWKVFSHLKSSYKLFKFILHAYCTHHFSGHPHVSCFFSLCPAC